MENNEAQEEVISDVEYIDGEQSGIRHMRTEHENGECLQIQGGWKSQEACLNCMLYAFHKVRHYNPADILYVRLKEREEPVAPEDAIHLRRWLSARGLLDTTCDYLMASFWMIRDFGFADVRLRYLRGKWLITLLHPMLRKTYSAGGYTSIDVTLRHALHAFTKDNQEALTEPVLGTLLKGYGLQESS